MSFDLIEAEIAELAPGENSSGMKADRIQRLFDGIKSGDVAAINKALRNAAELASPLDRLDRASLREILIKIVGELGMQSPARMVDAALPEPGPTDKAAALQGSAMCFAEVKPWESPVNVGLVLEEIRRSQCRFLILPQHADIALALWIAHTWVFELFDFSLYVLIHSPAPECGKSRVLDVIHSIVCRPAKGSSFSAPVLFRAVEKYKPTLLIDEGDAFLDSEELRGVMNDGYSRSSMIYRCQGDDNDVRGFSAYCPKAIAKIGKLTGKWSTVASRSVMIPMRRKLKEERIERFQSRKWKAEAEPLRRKLARFAADYGQGLAASEPSLPDELGDRQRESWLPLLAIADAAGGDWPKLARTAAVALCAEGLKTEDSTLSEALLHDIRDVFAAREKDGIQDADRIFSKDLCEELAKIELRPWAEFGNKEKPISPTQLARLLKGYGIEPRQQKIAGSNRNGFARTDFEEAWKRYLDDRDTQKQPDSPDSRLYRVYQADSKEFKGDSETLPQGVGRVLNMAPKPNGINAVDSVESKKPENGDSVKGMPASDPASEEVPQTKPATDWMEGIRERIAAVREKMALEEGTI